MQVVIYSSKESSGIFVYRIVDIIDNNKKIKNVLRLKGNSSSIVFQVKK